MSNSFWKGIGYLALGVVGIMLAWWVLKLAIVLALKVVLPLAIVGGIGYIIYKAVSKDKSLPGSGTPLP